MSGKVPITVAHGDGIGPEIMESTLQILQAAGAELEPHRIEIGESVYKSGFTSGIKPEAWATLRKTGVFLKAPITTPQGGGYKSLNVSVRKTLGLFANVRPCKALHPYVNTRHPNIDLVIIRENEEDLYAGIEYRQTGEAYECLKVISRPGSERIIRYAFEYARAYGKKEVTCMVKDNIMKMTDGLFHSVFEEIGAEYPDIQKKSQIIDIGSALLADRPENYEVVVTLNLYGDIISDIVAQIAGSVGLFGSANVGMNAAMFEAIHGSAPDIAGKGIANPSGLLNAAVMMLVHIGQPAIAARIRNAWLATLEDGIHTGDIYKEDLSKQKVGTADFTRAVIENLGRSPKHFEPVHYGEDARISIPAYKRRSYRKELVGVDIYLDDIRYTAEELGRKLEALAGPEFQLNVITNRGVKVYPGGYPETFCSDHWRVRFIDRNAESKDDGLKLVPITFDSVLALQKRLSDSDFQVIKVENLYTYDGSLGFSLAQGE